MVAGVGGSPLTGRADSAQMRATNMGLILRHLRAYGPRSRARLAVETGLSKATISSLVADLTQAGLLREGAEHRDGTVGRPGLMVDVDGRRVCGIGVEINVDFIALVMVDFNGATLSEVILPMAVDELPVDETLDRVCDMIITNLAVAREEGRWVASLTISPPGVIDYREGLVRFAPNIGWRRVPLVAEILRRLGPGAPEVHVENDAKLSALAEYATHESRGVRDLLFITGDIGVGVGIVSDGRLVRGWSGFSGEVGHLPLDPENRPCNCGRTGCWELIVGLGALLRLAGPDDDEIHDPNRPLEERLAVIRDRVDRGDPRSVQALATIVVDLARGLSLLIDVLNPKMIVLGGYFTFFADHIIPPLARELEHRRMDAGSAVELAPSGLGISSAAHGGALVALENVFADPTIVPAR